jgi:uncharacterized repeat protein (TIGR01451 family)
VSLTETLPAGTTFNAAASTAGWTESAPGSGVFNLAVGNLAAGASGSAMFVVTVNNPAVPGQTQIVNTATVADDGTHGVDPTPADNTGTDTDTLSAAPDLRVTVSDGVPSATPGGTLRYTLSYANAGSRGATGVSLTETLPAGTTFNAAASTAGWTESAPGSGVFKLAVGNLAAGNAPASVVFVVLVNNPAVRGQTAIVNTASIVDDASNGADPTPSNNTATDTNALLPLTADLRVTNTASVPTIHAGQLVRFTLVARNLGRNPALNVMLRDAVPTGATLVAFAAPAGWVVRRPAVGGVGLVWATRTSLSAGAAATFQLVVRANARAAAGSALHNTARVSTSTPDTRANNNSANAAVRVVASLTRATFTLVGRNADHRSELGLFLVDDASGRIGKVRPGDPGYALAALGRRQFSFDRFSPVGTRHTVNLPVGGFYGWYLVQNDSSASFLARNPTNRLGAGPLMFFSFRAANPDGVDHLRQYSPTRVGFEDLTFGGDWDFNDLIVDKQ